MYFRANHHDEKHHRKETFCEIRNNHVKTWFIVYMRQKLQKKYGFVIIELIFTNCGMNFFKLITII